MRRFLPLFLIAVIGAGALSTPSQAANNQWFCDFVRGPAGSVNAADSLAMASAWLPALTHLVNAIPTLSYREVNALKEDMESGSIERLARAIQSRESTINEARQNALSLQELMQNIATERDNTKLIGLWLKVVFFLADSVWAYQLTDLISARVITLDAIPPPWGPVLKKDDPEHQRLGILGGRDHLIRDIVMCTLPSLGLGKPLDDQGRMLAR